MTWLLEVSEGLDRGLKADLSSKVVTIGRDSTQSNFVLNDEMVSRLHASLTLLDDGTVQLSDKNSTHGTYVNEQKITEPVKLNTGDILRLGNTKLVLSWSDQAPAVLAAQTPVTSITIGRETTNSLVINEPKVSRNHARLEQRDGLFYLTDLDSTHGTSLNGEMIRGTQEINPSSWINIGGINYFFDGKNLKTEQGTIVATLGKVTGSGFLANLSLNAIKTVRPAYLAAAAALIVLAAASTFLLLSQVDRGGLAVQQALDFSGFQSFSHENVTISMLEGTIPDGSSVSIKRNNNPPSFGHASILAEAYDITLPPGSFTEGVVAITIPYDASKISRDLEAEDNIAAAYFSEQEQNWMPVAYDIDLASNTVIIYPDSFSTYAVIYYRDGRDALITKPQNNYYSMSFTPFDDEELLKIIRDMEAELEISPNALQAGFKSFYDTYRLEKGTVTIFNTIFEPASLKVIDKKMSTIGYGVAAVKIANDLKQGKYLPAIKTANTTSIGIMASKLGMKGLKIAMLSVVIIDIALGEFIEEALDSNLVKWDTAYRKYYMDIMPRTGVQWYRIAQDIWDQSDSPDDFQERLDEELKKYTEYVFTNPKTYDDFTFFLRDIRGDGTGELYILRKIAERYRNEIKATTLSSVMIRIIMGVENEARREVATQKRELWNLINKNYSVTVILENHEQVKDLSHTLVNFVNLNGKIVHSQSFDENGMVELPMTLHGFLENDCPTRVEVMIKEEADTFYHSDSYQLNIDKPNILIMVPYKVEELLEIRAPQDILDDEGVVDTSYIFESFGKGIPDNASYHWKINNSLVGGDQPSISISFKDPGLKTIELSARWPSRTASGHSYIKEVVASPLSFSIEEVPDDTEIRHDSIDICGEWKASRSGGAGTTITNVDISQLPVGASFDMRFNAYDVPDKFIVEYEGVVVFDSGWRGAQNYVDANPDLYPGGLSGSGSGTREAMFVKNRDDSFIVTVIGPESGTAWDYAIRANCP